MCRKCTKRIEGITCTLTRHWSARIADRSSFFLPASRNSTLRRALPTSLRDAVSAVRRARQAVARLLLARCSTLYALTVARSARFPSSPTTIVPSTAASASRTDPITDSICARDAKDSRKRKCFRLSFYVIFLQICNISPNSKGKKSAIRFDFYTIRRKSDTALTKKGMYGIIWNR